MRATYGTPGSGRGAARAPLFCGKGLPTKKVDVFTCYFGSYMVSIAPIVSGVRYEFHVPKPTIGITSKQMH